MLERPPPKALSVSLVGGSLVPLLALMALDADRLGLGPHAFAWMGLLLVAGGHVGFGRSSSSGALPAGV